MKEFNIGDRITAKFATINKNDTLAEYKEECAKPEIVTEMRDWDGHQVEDKYTSWRVEPCQVEQVFVVTPAEWEELTNSFQDDNILWRGKGGTIYTGSNPNFNYDSLDPASLDDYKLNNARLVTIIQNRETGEAVAVDPQGYDYARYVGIEVAG